jgi:hypothetical protein
LQRYVKSLSGYKRNVLPDLTSAERTRIVAEWRHCFDEWGYPVS